MARQLLEDAEEAYSDLGAARFVRDTKLRLAELALYEGKAGLAIEQAEEGIRATSSVAGVEDINMGFERVAGLALVATGHHDDGCRRLATTLAKATAGNRDDFEAVLARQGLVLADGDAAGKLAEELAAEVGRLGIVRLASIPAVAPTMHS